MARHRDKSQKKKPGPAGTGLQEFRSGLKDFPAHYDSLILFIILFFCYNIVSIVSVSGDTVPAGLLPVALIYDHSIFLDGPHIQGVFSGVIQSPDVAYAFPQVNGRIVSFFPIVTPVLVSPLYGLFALMSWILNVPLSLSLAGAFAKSSASCIAAVSGVLLYLSVKELFSKKTALLTVVVYAFATSTWSVSSQALWQHGTVELLLILLIYCIIRNERHPSPWMIIIMGIVSGLFIFNRPPDAILLIPILVYIVKECRASAGYFGLACIAGSLPFLVYNILVFGNVFGGYIKNTGLFQIGPDAFFGFFSLLIAPNTGLLVFSPVLIFSIYGYFRLGTLDRPVIRDLLFWFGPVIVLDIIVYSFFGSWFSSTAYSYGQRFLTGFIPVLALYLGVVISEVFDSGRKDTGTRLVQVCFVMLVVVSVVIQAIGVFLYPYNTVKSMDPSRVWDTDHLIIVESCNTGIRNISQVILLNVPPFPPVFQVPVYHQVPGPPS